MRKIIENYQFIPSEKKVVFTDYGQIQLENIEVIMNVTKGQLIYWRARGFSGVVIGNYILLENLEIEGMNAADELYISYEDNSLDVGIADTPSADAAGRLRVSEPITVFDSKLLFDDSRLFWDEQLEEGSGISSNYSRDRASVVLTSTAETAGLFTRQTYMNFNYRTGKSHLILISSTLQKSGSGTGVRRRLGLFDNSNGLFFEDFEGSMNVVRRYSTEGYPQDETIRQDQWNIDPMDGTGKSGIDLDFEKSQMFVIDFAWLGVGRVRMGFFVNGKIYYAHEFNNTNIRSGVFMSTPNLPVRGQLETTADSPEVSIEMIGASVISEGSDEILGSMRYASTNGTHVVCTNENTLYAILGIRLKSGYQGASVDVENINLQVQTASDQIEWVLKFRPTINGTFTYVDEPQSAVQVARGSSSNTVTAGIDIGGGFIGAAGVPIGGTGSMSQAILNAMKLGFNIAGDADEIVLCARPVAGATGVYVEGGMSWRELL